MKRAATLAILWSVLAWQTLALPGYGAPVTRAGNVVAAVRLQPAGTWLPLQVRRGEETLDLVIKFPPQQ